MKYFTNSSYTENSLKVEYRSLCKKLHPDVGGDADKFKEMMDEYISIKISINNTNYYSEYSSSKPKQQKRKDSEFNSKPKTHSKEKSEFNKKSKSSEELRYSILYNSLSRYRYIDETLKEFLRKISVLPFKDVEIVYYKFFEEIKIIMTADIKYTGKVWQDQFINIGIDCRYGKKQEINSLDNISKSIVEKNYSPNKWLKLELTKTFYVKDSNNNDFEIYLKPTDKDYHWNPEHSITLKNINITILGN